jgi:hypothetical protein
MSSKDVTVREWTCDACGFHTHADTTQRDSPSGWKIVSTTIDMGPSGPCPKGLDLCPACSMDEASAIARYKRLTGQ